MTKLLDIEYVAHTEVISVADPDDQWDRDSTRSSYTLTRACISKHGDCPISNVNEGDTVHVVWASYVTGDTFGSDSAIEFLAAFKDVKKANQLVRKLNEYAPSDYAGWEIGIELDEGEIYKLYIPWLGYFEHLEELNITEVTVT